MSFFDDKQEIIKVELTTYGRYLISRGKFKPAYYEFFDDDIIYDWFNDKDELLTTTALMSNKNHKKMVLIQEYIGSKFGEDLRVIVIGSKVVGIMNRKSVNGDFRANISKGGYGELYPITEEIEKISIKATNLLGLDIAGIDLLFDGDSFRVCEANACPGFKGFEKYCNFNIADHITEYIVNKGQK